MLQKIFLLLTLAQPIPVLPPDSVISDDHLWWDDARPQRAILYIDTTAWPETISC